MNAVSAMLKACKWGLLCAVIAGLGYWYANDQNSKIDPYYFLNPKLPIAVPFPIDKAGYKIQAKFWRLPHSTQVENGSYIIALRYKIKEEASNVDFWKHLRVPIKIKVYALANNKKVDMWHRSKVEYYDYAQEKKINLQLPPDVYFPNPYDQPVAADGFLEAGKWYRAEDWVLAWLDNLPPGEYMIEAETLEDRSKIAGIETDLAIREQHYGK